VSQLSFSSPAKINLFLAITGRREDGFHELVSVAAPVEWGDTLTVEVDETNSATIPGKFSLTCDDPMVPVNGENLVLKAAEAFRAATSWRRGVRFSLEKRIPMGAGLGGGSSNAATALRALNEFAGKPLDSAALTSVAAKVGSDCALFLRDGPVVMRGRGELVESLPPAIMARLTGRSVLIFKPAFGISTAWAYARLAAAAPKGYLPRAEAELRLAIWLRAVSGPGKPTTPEANAGDLLYNNMEPPAFEKFPALPALLERLGKKFGCAAHMSGSGSACFALLNDRSPVTEITAAIREAWGDSAFVVQTRLQ